MKRIALISPFLNESDGLYFFLQSLEKVFFDSDYTWTLYLIDDGSNDDSVQIIRDYSNTETKIELHLIQMEFNAGHQVAIYEGLKVAAERNFDYYIVLDSDGQDDVNIIPQLFAMSGKDIVFVQRTTRAEGIFFRIGYLLYQIIFRIISGKEINFGNYSLISHRVVRYLLATKFVHFPTALLKSPLTRSYIRAKRLKRRHGKSKMSTGKLIHHALLSLVEDAEMIVHFFLKCTFVVLVFFLLSIGNIIYQKFISHTAILGWTSVTSIGLLNLVFISFGLFTINLSILKTGRANLLDSKVKHEQLNLPLSQLHK
jgi:glycosyltransferase involved in cell wall biosynthesis